MKTWFDVAVEELRNQERAVQLLDEEKEQWRKEEVQSREEIRKLQRERDGFAAQARDQAKQLEEARRVAENKTGALVELETLRGELRKSQQDMVWVKDAVLRAGYHLDVGTSDETESGYRLRCDSCHHFNGEAHDVLHREWSREARAEARDRARELGVAATMFQCGLEAWPMAVTLRQGREGHAGGIRSPADARRGTAGLGDC
jgi:ribosomal protein S1